MKFCIVVFFNLLTYFSFAQNDLVKIIENKYEENPTDAIIYADSTLNYNQNLPDSTIILLEHFRALSYYKIGDFSKTLELYNNLKPKVDKSSEQYVKILLNMSNSNVELGNFTDATNQALEALKISETKEFFNFVGAANNALSYIYFKNDDYKKSFDYLQKSVDLYKEQQDSIKIAVTYNNIAIIYNRQKDFKQALLYNEKALIISSLIEDWVGVGKSYSNIGRIYETKKNYAKAIEFYEKAIDNNNAHNIKNSIPYRNLGDVYFELNQLDITNKYYNIALEIETLKNNPLVLHILYNGLLKTAISQNKYDKAITYQAKVDSLNTIRVEKENIESLKMLENQHKLVESQANLAYQKEELKQEKEINFKNKLIFGGIVISLILLFMFLYQKIIYSKLKISKEKLIMEQKVLRSQMNPHFIFNALSAIQNSLLENEPIESATYLSRFAKLIRQNFDFINQSKIVLNEELDALKNYLDTQKMRFNNKFDYEILIGENVNIDMIEIPPLLLQPFVENAIEHGFKNKKDKGLISLSITVNNNYVCYSVSDNGKGYSKKENDKKLHSLDVFKKRLKLIGNKDEKTFKIESSNKGTIIKFCLKQW